MDALDVIWKFGRESYAPGGAVKYFFGKKEHRHASSAFQERLQAMERAKGGNIVVIDGMIITAYKN